MWFYRFYTSSKICDDVELLLNYFLDPSFWGVARWDGCSSACMIQHGMRRWDAFSVWKCWYVICHSTFLWCCFWIPWLWCSLWTCLENWIWSWSVVGVLVSAWLSSLISWFMITNVMMGLHVWWNWSLSYVVGGLATHWLQWDNSDVDYLYPWGWCNVGVDPLVSLVYGHLCIRVVALGWEDGWCWVLE